MNLKVYALRSWKKRFVIKEAMVKEKSLAYQIRVRLKEKLAFL